MAHAIPIQDHPDESTLIPRDAGLLDTLTPFNVALANGEEVEEYVANHADLTSLLEAVCARLRASFGAGAELSLELYSDPEQQDQYLALYVRQEKYEAGILHQIESVTSPFMSQLEAASGHLLITTDFRRPRG